MKRFFAMMLMMLAMPVVASGTILFQENFDGVGAGTGLDSLGWTNGAWTVSANTIDSGNSATVGGGGNTEHAIGHTLGAGEHFQIDVVHYGPGGAAYFGAVNAAGNRIFWNHFNAWAGGAIEFQSEAPPGVTNEQQFDFGLQEPRTTRLEIFETTAKLSFDPDGGGGFINMFELQPGREFGLGDLDKIQLFSTSASPGAAFWDSIVVQVIPEPASMGLLAMGALAMLRRRRAM
jgi:hypothetical protein